MTAYAHVRAELLAPHEIEASIALSPIIYMPFGTLEYHGPHLPVGLDALTATAVCQRAAARSGGIVLPPFFYGTGGTHANYPWSIMLDGPEAIALVVRKTLERVRDLGVQICVLFSGHFAAEQLAALRSVKDQWVAGGAPPWVLVSSVEQHLAGMPVPDHAGEFETTLLNATHPELVHLNRLPPVSTDPDPDHGDDSFGSQRHLPAHPLRGIIGADPRRFDRRKSLALLDALTKGVLADVEAARGVEHAGITQDQA